jgi:hypothetical protein
VIVKDAENDVLMGFCHNGSVATPFMNSMLGAFMEDMARPIQKGLPRRLTEYHDCGGPYIHDNRARIAKYFLDHTDYQWLWMLDNDIQFPADSLYRMLSAAEAHEAPILGALYWNQYPGSECFTSWLLISPGKGIRALPYAPVLPGQLPEVTAVGMGCTLIHRDVLQDVADMHEDDPWDTFGADILLELEDGAFIAGVSMDHFDESILKGREVVKNHGRCGEDVTFCLRARRAGHISYGLPALTVEHFKAHPMVHGHQRHDAQEANGSTRSPIHLPK